MSPGNINKSGMVVRPCNPWAAEVETDRSLGLQAGQPISLACLMMRGLISEKRRVTLKKHQGFLSGLHMHTDRCVTHTYAHLTQGTHTQGGTILPLQNADPTTLGWQSLPLPLPSCPLAHWSLVGFVCFSCFCVVAARVSH